MLRTREGRGGGGVGLIGMGRGRERGGDVGGDIPRLCFAFFYGS